MCSMQGIQKFYDQTYSGDQQTVATTKMSFRKGHYVERGANSNFASTTQLNKHTKLWGMDTLVSQAHNNIIDSQSITILQQI